MRSVIVVLKNAVALAGVLLPSETFGYAVDELLCTLGTTRDDVRHVFTIDDGAVQHYDSEVADITTAL